MGQSRIICNNTGQSDVDAARVVASLSRILFVTEEFQKYVAAAKKEFQKPLVKEGKVKKSTFVVTPLDAKK